MFKINRRTLLKSGAAIALTSAFPGIHSFAIDKIEKPKENNYAGFKQFKLGQLDLFVLSDGFIRDTNVDAYSPRADVKKLKNILIDNFRSDKYIDMAMNILLVKTKDRLILFDSGLGIFADDNAGF